MFLDSADGVVFKGAVGCGIRLAVVSFISVASGSGMWGRSSDIQ
jgi:hypothetical protein